MNECIPCIPDDSDTCTRCLATLGQTKPIGRFVVNRTNVAERQNKIVEWLVDTVVLQDRIDVLAKEIVGMER